MNKKMYSEPFKSVCKVGDMYGKWKVIKFDHAESNEYETGIGKVKTFYDNYWLCECQCEHHTQSVVKEKKLLYGESTKCKICAGKQSGEVRVSRGVDLSGKRIGYLEVIKVHEYTNEEKEYARINNKKLNRAYDCACHRCGRGIAPRTDYAVIEVSHLNTHMKKRPDTASCGCMRQYMLQQGVRKTHGMFGTKIYSIWHNTKNICNNPNASSYNLYGGRGITMYKDWVDNFEVFYDWALKTGYTEELSLSRKDQNGNFDPSNCIWVDKKHQTIGDSSRVIELGNKKYTMAQAADMSKVSYSTYRYRQDKEGWSENDKLFIPALNSQYSRERYREEHGIVDALIFDDNTESSNSELYRLTPEQIKNILDNAPTADELFNKKSISNLLNL